MLPTLQVTRHHSGLGQCYAFNSILLLMVFVPATDKVQQVHKTGCLVCALCASPRDWSCFTNAAVLLIIQGHSSKDFHRSWFQEQRQTKAFLLIRNLKEKLTDQ